MYKYKIAGVNLQINSLNSYLENRIKDFIIEENLQSDINIDIVICDKIEKPEGELISKENIIWLKKYNDLGYIMYRVDEATGIVLTKLEADILWKNIRIFCLDVQWIINKDKSMEDKLMKDEDIYWAQFHSFLLMGIAFRNYLISNNGIVIHSSSIAYENNGIIFSAPSGTGKSTHVGLWKKLFTDKVTVVNDDTPAITINENQVFLQGTPWSGSTDIFKNLCVPLKAIVFLEQAPKNDIIKLEVLEALQYLMPRCFLPYFDESLLNKAQDIIEKIVINVPMYKLKCLPDYNAVELVENCIQF